MDDRPIRSNSGGRTRSKGAAQASRQNPWSQPSQHSQLSPRIPSPVAPGTAAVTVAAGAGTPSAVAVRRASSSAAQQLTEALSGRRVLVVDDNMVNRKVISRMLQRYGVQVEEVDGGGKAVKRVQEMRDGAALPLDCVFMDIQMPGMDGYEAVSHIRSMEQETPPTTAASPSSSTPPASPSPPQSKAPVKSSTTPPATTSPSALKALLPKSLSDTKIPPDTRNPSASGSPRSSSAEAAAEAPVAGAARAEKGRLLVIALTADVGSGTRERCAKAGMDGYMTKPIEEQQLSRVVLPFFAALAGNF
ncbi:unnamed protein product [Closterium sp. NIES-64]|nr:unnamed protein product [Closterium sp. NIES-64]